MRMASMSGRQWSLASTAISFLCLISFIAVSDYNNRKESAYRDVQIKTFAAYSDWNNYIGTLRGLLLTTNGVEKTLNDASLRKKITEQHLGELRAQLPAIDRELWVPLGAFIDSIDAGLSLGQELEDTGRLFLLQPDLPAVYKEGRVGLYSLTGKDATAHMGPLAAYQYFQLVSRLKGMNVLFDELFSNRLDAFLASISETSLEMQRQFFTLRLIFLFATSAIIAITLVLLYRMNRSLRALAESTKQELITTRTHLNEVQDYLDSAQFQQSLFEMVAGLSHELNTPLGNCMAISSHLEALAGKLSDAIHSGSLTREAFDSGMKESREGFTLMNESLDQMRIQIETFKRLSSVNHELEGSLVSLREYLARDVPRIAAEIAPGLKAEGTLHSPDDIRLYYRYLDSILVQLFKNSREHGKASKLAVDCALEGDELVLKVADNGRGVDKSTLPRMAEPFFTTARGQNHMGLGLSIVASLVANKLKGSIEFSPLSPGLLVTMRLKIGQAGELPDLRT